jgi:hypothetical protein
MAVNEVFLIFIRIPIRLHDLATFYHDVCALAIVNKADVSAAARKDRFSNGDNTGRILATFSRSGNTDSLQAKMPLYIPWHCDVTQAKYGSLLPPRRECPFFGRIPVTRRTALGYFRPVPQGELMIMPRYEYKVVPAPTRGEKVRGLKTGPERFAHAVATLMNSFGREGWEYVRADTLPCEERTGLTGRTTVFHNVLVFRRAIAEQMPAADTATQELPVTSDRPAALAAAKTLDPVDFPAEKPPLSTQAPEGETPRIALRPEGKSPRIGPARDAEVAAE